MSNPLVSQSPEEVLLKAKKLFQEGALNKAEQRSREYVQLAPSSANGHFLLGAILLKKGNARESLAEFTEGAKYSEPSALELKFVALDYAILEDFLSADKWLTKSLERNPQDSDAWYHLGRTKYTEDKLEEAVLAFQECLRRDPQNVRAEANRGLALEGLGRTADALAAYQTSILWQEHLGQKIAEPYIDLGNLLMEQNRLADAVPYLLKGVAFSPKQSRPHEKLGKAYLRLNQLLTAQKEFETAVELEPGNASSHYMLGQVYRKEGLFDRAQREFDRVAVLNGSHSSIPN